MARKYIKESKQATQLPLRTGSTALYIRVSTERQANEGNSLDAQRAKLLAHCALKGWTVDDQHIFVDAGISGKSTEGRDAFNAMLQAATDGSIDRIVVTKRDRFARNTVDFLTKTDELNRLGVALVCLDIDLDTSTPTGKLIATVFAGFAEWEASLITERVMSGKAQNAKSGGYNGSRCPYGYTYTDHKFVEDPAQAEVISSIFSQFNAGASLNAIMRHLNDTGTPTATGKGSWFVNGVKHILSNGAYAGVGQWAGTESDQGSHPAIIDRAIYDAAQKRLEMLSRGARVDLR